MKFVLVLQHKDLRQCDLEDLQHVLPAPPNYHFDYSVIRIPVHREFTIDENMHHHLCQQKIDYAVLPDMAFADLGLIVSDMDSTFITIECVDEIAAGVGLQSQIAAITERSMRGEIDFENSLRERVALLKGLSIQQLQYVYDKILHLSPGAEWLIEQCRQHQVKFMLVSGGFTFFTDRLQQQYHLDYAFANELAMSDGKLNGELCGRIIDAQAKADILNEYAAKFDMDKSQILAIGDGANDIPMLQSAGIGIAYHAKPKTEQAANICTRYGGLDTVRKWFR